MANNFKNPWGVGGEYYNQNASPTEFLPEDSAYRTGINPNTGESVEAYQGRVFSSSDGKSAKKEEIYSGFPGDGRIHIVNDFHGDVYFKPEGA